MGRGEGERGGEVRKMEGIGGREMGKLQWTRPSSGGNRRIGLLQEMVVARAERCPIL